MISMMDKVYHPNFTVLPERRPHIAASRSFSSQMPYVSARELIMRDQLFVVDQQASAWEFTEAIPTRPAGRTTFIP